MLRVLALVGSRSGGAGFVVVAAPTTARLQRLWPVPNFPSPFQSFIRLGFAWIPTQVENDEWQKSRSAEQYRCAGACWRVGEKGEGAADGASVACRLMWRLIPFPRLSKKKISRFIRGKRAGIMEKMTKIKNMQKQTEAKKAARLVRVIVSGVCVCVCVCFGN